VMTPTDQTALTAGANGLGAPRVTAVPTRTLAVDAGLTTGTCHDHHAGSG
jgi:hypothetical protein